MSDAPFPATARAETPAAPVRGLPRPLLWTVLVVGLVVNALTSILSWPLAIGIVTGVIVLGVGGLLVRDHYRGRSRS
jgi:hypothetical protein